MRALALVQLEGLGLEQEPLPVDDRPLGSLTTS